MSRSAGPHAAPVNARGERPVDVPIYYKVDANPHRWRATGGIRRFPAEFRKTPPGAAHRRQTPDARDVTIATIDARAAQFCHIATVRGRAHAESPPPARRAAWAGERRIGPDDHPGVRPRRQSMQDVMKNDVTPRERRALIKKETDACRGVQECRPPCGTRERSWRASVRCPSLLQTRCQTPRRHGIAVFRPKWRVRRRLTRLEARVGCHHAPARCAFLPHRHTAHRPHSDAPRTPSG